MATWQQGINSGGFLAGIGTQNENAPKASDINATLGLIRENNELARSGANNVALTGLRGLAGVADIYKQQQQQERKAAFQKGYADAYASGDREQMRNHQFRDKYAREGYQLQKILQLRPTSTRTMEGSTIKLFST